nr:S-layer homology domain-containing protein [Paenibacillus sp. ACRSA]
MTVTVGWGELLSATSSASFTTSDLAIGTHTITAAYSGDDTHPASETTTTVTVHPKYTVVYDGNGSTGGDVPANSSSYNGIKASISSNNGSLVRSGYTFGGWNTQADGLGVDYSADAEGVITSDVTLYVKWIKTLDVGTGTASDPYQITTAEELNTVRNYLDPDLYFKLAADIDLSSYGEAWLPIGEGVHGRFRGHIDGNGHKITGLTINRPNDNYAGLFGYITYDASVSNVILENVNVTGRQYVGGLAGRIDGGGISNSSVSGSVKGTGTMVGGMIGYNYYGTVNNSFATAHITGNSNNVGGLVGSNFGEISYGYAVGNVTGNGNNIGGLVGNNGGEINYSYAAGGVTGSGSNIGGLIGNNSSGPISNSFYDSGTTGQSDVDKGIGRSSTEMKTQSTYEDSNWDFTSRWGISPSHNNGYPYLQAIQKFVTYDGNGNIGGSAPTDSKSYAPGETVHVYSDTVTLMKPHYTFAGWNTQADGSGTDYAPGVAFSMSSSDLTLYAKWIPNLTYKVTYNDNGSTGGSVPTDSGSYEEGDTVSVSGNNGNLEKTGYTFAGWNTAADGSGISYAREMNFLMGTQHVTLYAQWVSANALLSGLSLEHGVLQFSPTQTNYAVRVEHSVTNLSLFLNTEDATQSLKVTGADYDSVTGNKYTYNASSLIVGPNTVQITVTAHDGSHTTYVVTITREGILGEPMPLDPSVRTLAFPGGLVIELPDGLVIPEGAILTVRNSDAVPSGEIKLAKAGQVIDFQFEGMTITQPVQITLGYDESADRSKLAIYYYNESTGKWEYRPSQVTDHGAKTTVNHFSTYGVLADTTAPDQVIITSGAKTTHSITLHLAANDDSGVAKYRIYRDGILLVETTESTFVDTGLSASKQYIYTAKAVDRLGNISDASEGITVKTNSDGGSSTPGGGSYTAPPPAIGPKVAGTDGRLTLPAGQAGEVSYSDEIKIVIPAGAASRELIVTIDKVSDSDVKTLITSKDALVSPVFEIQKNVVENFDKPVSISFTLDLSSLKDNEKPVVFYYEEAKKEWVRVGGTVSGNSITVEVDHFTKFAVFAVADAPLPTTEDTTKVSFSDITGHWAEARIKQAVSAGIVGGYPDHTFKPGRTVTRAEFAVMLMNALGPQGAGAALAFTDKALIGAWAQQSIAQAVNAGIITGYEDGSFRPNAEITRAEMATMIAKALGLTDRTTETSGFADDQDIPDWARGAVAIIKNLGIIEGKGANQFAPGDKTTRAEAVSVLLKMLEQKNK